MADETIDITGSPNFSDYWSEYREYEDMYRCGIISSEEFEKIKQFLKLNHDIRQSGR